MYVLVLANQKGGVGKTTLTSHVAVEAVRADSLRTVLIDFDPQGTLTKWWKRRKDQTIDLAKGVSVDQLPSQLAALREAGVQLVVIDTPPSVHQFVGDVLRHASLVVIPTSPSPYDLGEIGPTVDAVRAADVRMVFVINDANVRTKLTGEAAIVLSQHGTIAPVILGSRNDFRVSGNDGRTAPELDDQSTSAEEVAQLWGYLRGQLAHTKKTAA